MPAPLNASTNACNGSIAPSLVIRTCGVPHFEQTMLGTVYLTAKAGALANTFRLRNQLGVVHFTRANARLLAVAPLMSLMHPIPGAATWRREAMAACGAKVAERSWVVEFDFITAPTVATGEGVMFLAKTTHGWRVWRHRFA